MGWKVMISVDGNTQISNWGRPDNLSVMDFKFWGWEDIFVGKKDGWGFGRLYRNPPLSKIGLDEINLLLEIICCSGIGDAGSVEKSVVGEKCNLCFGVEREIVDVYSEQLGERQEPWGTPTLMFLLEESWLSALTENFLFRRKDLRMLTNWVGTPKEINLKMKLGCQTFLQRFWPRLCSLNCYQLEGGAVMMSKAELFGAD